MGKIESGEEERECREEQKKKRGRTKGKGEEEEILIFDSITLLCFSSFPIWVLTQINS